MSLARRAQSSVEYLSIVGIALMLLIPATILFTNYARNTSDEVMSNQLSLIGNTMIAKAEEMYVLGAGSWATIDVNLPDDIINVSIANNEELAFAYSTQTGISHAVFYSFRFNINNGSDCSSICNLGLTPGFNAVRIEANGTAVKINKVG